jgi:hypothetical protein
MFKIIVSVKNEEALKYIRDLAESSEAKPIELDREIVVVSQELNQCSNCKRCIFFLMFTKHV